MIPSAIRGPADTPQTNEEDRGTTARPTGQDEISKGPRSPRGGGGSFACAVPNTQLTTPSVICFRGLRRGSGAAAGVYPDNGVGLPQFPF